MHIAPPHRQEGIQSESEDSDYVTLLWDVRLSELTLSTTGYGVKLGLANWPKASWMQGLRQSNTSNGSKRTTKGGWQIADGLCH